MSKHTEGPWFVTRSGSGIHKYIEARICDGMVQEVACCGPTLNHEHSEANARLIAAAPDLLAALTLFYGSNNTKYDATELQEIARAAISKATGGE